MKRVIDNPFSESLNPEPGDRTYSVGYVCFNLQILPGQLAVLMEAAGVTFARMADGVPMLDGHSFIAVAEKAEAVRGEIKGKLQSTASN